MLVLELLGICATNCENIHIMKSNYFKKYVKEITMIKSILFCKFF